MLSYISGDVFQGNWKNGKRSGWGKYIYSSGEVYEGELEDDYFLEEEDYSY